MTNRAGLWSVVLLAGCGLFPGWSDGEDAGPSATDGGTAEIDASGDASIAPSTWRRIELPDGASDARVTGIHCTARDACVFVTDGDDDGLVLGGTDREITTTLRAIDEVGFIGIDRTSERLTARLRVEQATVFATGDFMNPASWEAVGMGTTSSDNAPFGLNGQELLGTHEGRWIHATTSGAVYEAYEEPSPSTVWDTIWSPLARPPTPSDIEALWRVDPTICYTGVGATTSSVPHATQNLWAADDLSMIVYPAGRTGYALPGVCISTDGGRRFYNAVFEDLGDDEPAPQAVTCLDADRCFAYCGLSFNPPYVYYTTNASDGVDSEWTRAELPSAIASRDDVRPRNLFFAPDGMHGWIAGSSSGAPMLLRTDDGGRSWRDVSASIRGAADSILHSGFALDADHVWVGGEGASWSTDRAE